MSNHLSATQMNLATYQCTSDQHIRTSYFICTSLSFALGWRFYEDWYLLFLQQIPFRKMRMKEYRQLSKKNAQVKNVFNLFCWVTWYFVHIYILHLIHIHFFSSAPANCHPYDLTPFASTNFDNQTLNLIILFSVTIVHLLSKLGLPCTSIQKHMYIISLFKDSLITQSQYI